MKLQERDEKTRLKGFKGWNYMRHRRGEKIGWLVGWTGGFAWLAILSVLWLFQGKTLHAAAGIGSVMIGGMLVLSLAPWKHPETKYWKLMLPLYGVLMGAVAVVIRLEGGIERLGLGGWSLMACLPLFLPFLTAGGRTWTIDGRSSDT